jgi:hypothetical protein
MNNNFTPYKEAWDLKELGFDEPCMAFYEPGNEEVQVVGVEQRYNNPELLRLKDFCAPLYQEAFRWFREKYGYVGGIKKLRGTRNMLGDFYKDEDNQFMILGDTYEEVELVCLRTLIEIVKGKEVAIICHTFS